MGCSVSDLTGETICARGHYPFHCTLHLLENRHSTAEVGDPYRHNMPPSNLVISPFFPLARCSVVESLSPDPSTFFIVRAECDAKSTALNSGNPITRALLFWRDAPETTGKYKGAVKHMTQIHPPQIAAISFQCIEQIFHYRDLMLNTQVEVNSTALWETAKKPLQKYERMELNFLLHVNSGKKSGEER